MRCLILATVLLAVAPAAAVVNYVIDDGRAELAISIDPGEDQIWFNTFPVEPGGEVITAISASFGRQGLAVPLNGLPIKLLLYEDLDGGLPWNATLLRSVDSAVRDANTIIIPRYEIPPTEVHGTMLVAVLFRNTTVQNKPIAALDTTAPSLALRSWAGWDNGVDETNLLSIPPDQMFPIEQIAAGNFIVRAEGTAIPEPSACLGLAGLAAIALSRRRSR